MRERDTHIYTYIPSVEREIANEQTGRGGRTTVSVRPTVTVSITRLVVVSLASARRSPTAPTRAVASALASVPGHCCS